MMTLDRPIQSAVLTDSLAGIIGYLRARHDKGLRDELWRVLVDVSNRFVRKLATHWQNEEEGIFPALRTVAPGHSTTLDGFKMEHARLCELACDLAARIAEGDMDSAEETARLLLAGLLEQVHREDTVVLQIVDSLKLNGLRRLARRLPRFKGSVPACARRKEGVDEGPCRRRRKGYIAVS